MPEAINISDLQLFNLLKPKFGEKEAEQLVNFVKAETQATLQKQYEYLSKDIKALKDDLHQIFHTKEDLVREVSNAKIDMIKWMFGFWFTLVLLILANWFLKH